MKGRDKCDLLNKIRQKIADENNIEFTIYECTFEGDCTGTCPKCESEREYLEKELEKKQEAGEKINLKGIFKLDDEVNTCPENPGFPEPGDNRPYDIDLPGDILPPDKPRYIKIQSKKYYQEAIKLVEQKRYDEAEKAIYSAIELDPNNIEYKNKLKEIENKQTKQMQYN